jgi:hypothetical protein
MHCHLTYEHLSVFRRSGIMSRGLSGTHTIDNPVVDRNFFARLDVSRGVIDAMRISPCVDFHIGRVAVIHESIVVAAENESVTAGIDVAVVQHSCTKVGRLSLELARVEV